MHKMIIIRGETATINGKETVRNGESTNIYGEATIKNGAVTIWMVKQLNPFDFC